MCLTLLRRVHEHHIHDVDHVLAGKQQIMLERKNNLMETTNPNASQVAHSGTFESIPVRNTCATLS